MKRWRQTLGLALALLLAAGGCGLPQAADSGRESAGWSNTAQTTAESEGSKTDTVIIVDQEEVPAYSGEPYVELDGDEPGFTEEELMEESFEEYSQLDELGRCGTAVACVGQDLMPQEERGDISQVKPTGWHSVRYENVEGGSLYNRCHLIGYQLTAENANEENLITGTRYMNVEGMLPFENEVADYVEETDGHVMYRVTPVYEGDNLVASGVQMEAESVRMRERVSPIMYLCTMCSRELRLTMPQETAGRKVAVPERQRAGFPGWTVPGIRRMAGRKAAMPQTQTIRRKRRRIRLRLPGTADREIIGKKCRPIS